MANETVTEIESSEPEGFGPAIDDATMQSMEEGASSKARGLSRRCVLSALARDSKELGDLSLHDPESYGAMRGAIEDFKNHARSLLEVAESASRRMYLCDCRDNAPELA